MIRFAVILSILMCLFGIIGAVGGHEFSRFSSRSRRSYKKSQKEVGPPTRPNTLWSEKTVKPYFDTSNTKSHIIVQVGNTAYLHCRVKNIGDKTVSWIRQVDYSILTVDTFRYTSDNRFRSVHQEGSNDWTLEISYTVEEDAGIYECQVNSEPKISQEITLDISTSEALIIGAPEIYIQSGNTMRLTCQILHTKTPPVYVFWYKGRRVINYDGSRSTISVQMKSSKSTISTLTIERSRAQDSGNYSCKPSFTAAASIIVNVVNEEKPAAMQSNEKQRSSSHRSSILFNILAIGLCNFFLIS